MAPFYYLLERGVDPVAAYQRTYKSIMRDIEFRTWYRGQPLGDAGAWGGLCFGGVWGLFFVDEAGCARTSAVGWAAVWLNPCCDPSLGD